MEMFIGVMLVGVFFALVANHKTLCEFQNTVMHDANGQLETLKKIMVLVKKWDQEGLPEQRNEETK